MTVRRVKVLHTLAAERCPHCGRALTLSEDKATPGRYLLEAPDTPAVELAGDAELATLELAAVVREHLQVCRRVVVA